MTREPGVRIESLTDHRDLVPVVARWIHEEWHDLIPHDSLESWEKALSKRIRPKGIHTTFVAFQGGKPVGVASLIMDDLPIRPALNPWLAEVWVLPEQRRQGIGRSLVRRVMEEAQAIQTPALYLYTPDRERFYEHLGWSLVERMRYHGKEIVVMEYEF